MDASGELLTALGLLAALLVFDLVALRYGVDSRERIGDTRSRASRPRDTFPFWK